MDAHARFAAAPDVYWRDVPGELLLFDARADDYLVLNEAAARIWRRLAAGVSPHAIAAELASEFDAPPERILSDVIEAAVGFRDRGLILAVQ